jgi:hypothetical protein
MAEEVNAPEQPFERFELVTAILLGLAAIGAAIAGMQSGQWGGKQLESFAQANSITTDASRAYSEAVSDMNSDYAAVGQAKRLILEGIDANSDADQIRSYKVASYYLREQLGEQAYDALKLPKDDDTQTPPAGDAAPAAAATSTAAADAEETGDEGEEGEEGNGEAAAETQPAAAASTAAPAGDDAEAVTEEDIEARMEPYSEDVLIRVLGTELHDDEAYGDAMFSEGMKLFDDAEKKFKEGQQANDNGDQFELAGLFYTIALFFAGLGLVFKTRMRWSFAALGAAAFLISTIFMMTRPWP